LSFVLVDEFSHSSSDLTRLARSFVATGENKYWDEYFHIIDWMAGDAVRPEYVNKELHRNEKIAQLDIMKNLNFSPSELAYLKQANDTSDTLVNTETQAMESIKQGVFVDGPFQLKEDETVQQFALRILFDTNYDNEVIKIAEPVGKFYAALDARTSKQVREASNNAAFWANIAFFLQIIVGLMVAGLTWFIIQVLFKPLDKIIKTMAAVDLGDDRINLTQELAEDGEVEISSLSKGFNFFNNGIKKLMGKFGVTIDELATSSETLSNIATQTQTAVSVQRNALDLVATAIQEMVATVQEVANNAASAATKAQDCNTESESGQKIVKMSIESIEELAKEMSSASSAITNVENNSNTITSVLDVIKGIADQTNLLALNAAIEAARAGEQGRGFAVVADEVRSLAKRTQDSTGEIQTMIENLQENSKIAVSAMEISNKQAGLCVDNTNKAGDALNVIAGFIDDIAAMSAQIATASEEQSVVVDDISKNIHEVLDEVEQTATAATATATNSEDLSKLSQELNTLTQQFKI